MLKHIVLFTLKPTAEEQRAEQEQPRFHSLLLFISLLCCVFLPESVLAARTPGIFEKAFSLAMKNYVEMPDPAALSSRAIAEMTSLLTARNIDSRKFEVDGSAPRNSDEAAKQVIRFYKEAAGSSDISPEELENAAIKGMLKALDGHSSLLSVREVKEINMGIRGSFGGVGLQVGIKSGQLVVIAPIEGTPAFRAGILAGDVILRIDGVTTKEMSLEGAVDRLRGEKGTRITVTIARPPFASTYDVALVRDTITVQSVKYRLLGDDIGYLKVAFFQGQTPNDVETALRDMGANGMKKLVLDLRSNPGGLLDASIAVSGKFLAPGSLAVTLQGRARSDRKEYRTSGSPLPADLPMIALMDKGTASGAEILAGALRDHKRAVIVGARSFGKGSVQTLFPLDDGSALRLTTALYYTPANESVEKTGIAPDVDVIERENEDAALNVAKSALRAYDGPGASHARLIQLASAAANDRREEFEQAKAKNTYEAYAAFLKAYPASGSRRPALQAMAALIEKQSDSYEGFRKFVAAYEDGQEFVPGKYQLALTGPEGLRVRDIAAFRKKGVGDNILAAKIRSSKGKYKDFSFDEIEELKKMGVPAAAVEAMIDATARANRESEERQNKKNLEDLLAEIQRMQKKLEDLKAAQQPGVSSPVAAGQGRTLGQAPGPSAADTATNCAARIAALEACKHLPSLGAMVCKAAAKAQFPCE